MVSLNTSAGPIDLTNLILSRKCGETTEIQDKDGNVIAEVTVTEIRGDKARIAFRAPRDVKVHRREVADAIRREQIEREGPREPHPKGRAA